MNFFRLSNFLTLYSLCWKIGLNYSLSMGLKNKFLKTFTDYLVLVNLKIEFVEAIWKQSSCLENWITNSIFRNNKLCSFSFTNLFILLLMVSPTKIVKTNILLLYYFLLYQKNTKKEIVVFMTTQKRKMGFFCSLQKELFWKGGILLIRDKFFRLLTFLKFL